MRILPLLLAVWLTQFSSGVNVVEVYATVTDAAGRPVPNLLKSDFTVSEDGRPEVVTTFVAGEFPASVALAIDRSWSMAGKPLVLARTAAHNFLGQLRPTDRSMLVAIGTETETIASLSSDRVAQHRALDALQPWGTTALYDAIITSVDLIQAAEGRRALVLLSDGDDRYSRAKAADALDRARRSDVLVYPIALGKKRPELFAQLAVLTGARSFHLRDPRQLEATFKSIAEELRYQYLLGYSPSRPIVAGEPEWRTIRVGVNRPGVTVRARDGYFAK